MELFSLFGQFQVAPPNSAIDSGGGEVSVRPGERNCLGGGGGGERNRV